MGFAYSGIPSLVQAPWTNNPNDFSTPILESWNYRHIALCLNERNTLMGLGLTPLVTTIPDVQVNYTHINAARQMIETMCLYVSGGNYFFRDASILVGNTYTTALSFIQAIRFQSIADLLSYCGLNQSNWLNLVMGNLSYSSRLTSDSTVIFKMVKELRTVVLKMNTTWAMNSFVSKSSGQSKSVFVPPGSPPDVWGISPVYNTTGVVDPSIVLTTTDVGGGQTQYSLFLSNPADVISSSITGFANIVKKVTFYWLYNWSGTSPKTDFTNSGIDSNILIAGPTSQPFTAAPFQFDGCGPFEPWSHWIHPIMTVNYAWTGVLGGYPLVNNTFQNDVNIGSWVF